MATVIFGGERELNLFTAGEPHPSMLDYMRNQAVQIGNYIEQTGNKFAQSVLDSYEHYYSDGALRNARAALSKVKSYFREDKISDLQSIYDIQQSSLVMQRFVMSQPDLRQMYHDGRCIGFAGTYVDPFPGKIGEQDYNYRRVMDGLVQFTEPTEEAPDGDDQFVIYGEDLHDGDRHLDLHEQVAITNVWERVKYSLARSMLDPSNPSGGSL